MSLSSSYAPISIIIILPNIIRMTMWEQVGVFMTTPLKPLYSIETGEFLHWRLMSATSLEINDLTFAPLYLTSCQSLLRVLIQATTKQLWGGEPSTFPLRFHNPPAHTDICPSESGAKLDTKPQLVAWCCPSCWKGRTSSVPWGQLRTALVIPFWTKLLFKVSVSWSWSCLKATSTHTPSQQKVKQVEFINGETDGDLDQGVFWEQDRRRRKRKNKMKEWRMKTR